MKAGCATLLVILAINLTLGAVSFNYVLNTVLGLTASPFFAFAGGLVFGELTVPLAVLCWILKGCGVHTPMVHL